MERHLAAILAADVVGYSRLMERDEAGTFQRLKSARKELFEPEIERHHGRIFKLTGDGLLAEFNSVANAVECAVTLQRGLHERNAGEAEGRRIAVRIGINLGEVIVDEDDRYGEGVNIAARLQQLAEPGGIWVSAKVAKEVDRKLDVALEPTGDHKVKNIEEPVAAFRVLFDGAPAPRVEPHRAALSVQRRTGARAAAMALLAVVIATGGTWWLWPRSTVDVASAPEGPSIAVLAFDNLSDDKEQGYLADGIAEDLTTDLARIPGLFVVSRNAAFGFRGKGLAPKEIAAKLGVRYVLEGSVRRSGDSIRINAQLIDAGTDGHLWAERYDGAWSEVFDLQNKVVEQVALALKLRLVEGQHAAEITGGTRNAEAYELFLRGREYERRGGPGDWRKALGLLQQAVKLDPDFGRAVAEIAWVYWYGAGLSTAREELGSQGEDLLAKADEYIVEAAMHPSPNYYQVQADRLLYQHRTDQAVQSAERAIALDPSDPFSYSEMAFALLFSGRPAETLEFLEATLRVDPGSLTPSRRFTQGIAFYLLGRYQDAVDTLNHLEPYEQRTAEHFWADYQGRWILMAAYLRLDRAADAKAAEAEMMKFLMDANDRELSLLLVQNNLPFKDYADLAKIAEPLRQYGVPEAPLGFDDKRQDRLTGAEIAKLVIGHENEGRKIETGEESSGKMLEDGTFYAHVGNWRDTGEAWVEGDAMCFSMPASFRNCAAFYRNPGGTLERRDEYYFVTQWDHFTFSITK